ncbi:MAG: hypothetical protein KDD66_02575 [Bdellovibrionales bacterium]|nr:hypothetical protein [Bdellovibrionales bacterium]
MFEAIKTPYLAETNGSFSAAQFSTNPPKDGPDKKQRESELQTSIEELKELQRRLYASNSYSVLLIFQAMDAAGKDSTIRAVMTGINPAGCQVYSFKKPSEEEIDHDFLWRTAKCLPERGRIGIFNRSYYEEVLVVKVHPEILGSQRLPFDAKGSNIWLQRYESICDHELHLARNGTVILKFWLNVSKEEQKQRFLKRLREPEKNWKFAAADMHERKLWDRYMLAYEEAVRATSKPWAPWYVIPADSKSYMRMQVADTIVHSLKSLGLEYPEVDQKLAAKFSDIERVLESE